MRLCTVDMSLDEQIKAKEITSLINQDIAQVKFKIVKKRFYATGLERSILEKSHILFITLPRKKISQDMYLELISYIDIGGCLILTLPRPRALPELGRWFEALRWELGINLSEQYVYGLPRIPYETRLLGSKLFINKSHVINYNSEPHFMKENGIKSYTSLALMDSKPVVLVAKKRRGKFIIFGTHEIFTESNSNYLNRLLLIASRKLDYLMYKENNRVQIGESNFYICLNHAILNQYLLSFYHHEYVFFKEPYSFTSIKDLESKIQSILANQKIIGSPPSLTDIRYTLHSLKLEGAI